MKNGMITIILAVLVLMQFDDFENPSALDWAKFGLIAVAVVLNLVVVFRGKGNED